MAKRPKYGGAEECPGCLQPVYPMERVSWAVASSSAFESFVFVIVIAIVFVFVFITAYLVERVSEFNCKFCICSFMLGQSKWELYYLDIFTPRDWRSGQYNAKEEGVNPKFGKYCRRFSRRTGELSTTGASPARCNHTDLTKKNDSIRNSCDVSHVNIKIYIFCYF